MFAMAEPITTIWSAPVVFVRLGAGVVPPTDEEPHAVIDPEERASTLYTVTATNATGHATATVSLTTSLIAPDPAPAPATLTIAVTT
jgi:hypothetical protein